MEAGGHGSFQEAGKMVTASGCGLRWEGKQGLERGEVRADLGPGGVRDLKDHLNSEVTSEKER